MADESTTTPPATGDNPNDPATPPGQDPAAGGDLGDAGKAALATERAARREAERQRKELETRLKELEPLAKRAKDLEDAKKTEAEKLNERLTAAEKRAADAETRALRAEVAQTKGLTPAQARRLAGSTQAELEADADDLLASFGGGAAVEDTTKPKAKKPVEQLRPGAMPNPPAPTLAQQIADAEKAGKWSEAQNLKAQQLLALANPNQ